MKYSLEVVVMENRKELHREAYEKLAKQHADLLTRLGAEGNCQEYFDDLIKRYSEPARFYHTIFHIKDCMKEFDSVREMSAKPDYLELALWYHDIIYVPARVDNEEKSIDWLINFCLDEAKLGINAYAEARWFIAVTKH